MADKVQRSMSIRRVESPIPVDALFLNPSRGSRLEIAIPLILFTVRAGEPIRFTVANPDRAQALAMR